MPYLFLPDKSNPTNMHANHQHIMRNQYCFRKPDSPDYIHNVILDSWLCVPDFRRVCLYRTISLLNFQISRAWLFKPLADTDKLICSFIIVSSIVFSLFAFVSTLFKNANSHCMLYWDIESVCPEYLTLKPELTVFIV